MDTQNPSRKVAYRHGFVIHLEPIEPRPVQVVGRNDIERLQFWASVISEDPITFASDIKLCEDRLTRTFPAHLDDHIRPHQANTPTGPYRFLFLPPLEYGSLEIKIGVEGAENLLTAFAGNAKLLVDLLTQYSPQAFVASIPIPPLLSKPVRAQLFNAEWIADLSSEQTDDAGRGKAENDLGDKQSGTSSSESNEGDGQRKRVSEYLKEKSDRALWLLANTSLLLPVAFSLAVLYVAFRGLEAERERVEHGRQDLEKREAALRDSILAREARLFEAFHSPKAASSAAPAASGGKP